MTLEELIKENDRRMALRKAMEYSPVEGEPNGSGRVRECGRWLPLSMVMDPAYSPSLRGHEMDMLRFRHDFEYWAYKCVRIIDKDTMLEIPFMLNAPQRRLLRVFEDMRRREQPIRLIMLKARQWGGSTFVQIYFAWIQIVHRRGWNSLICAHLKDSAANIRGMYSRLLAAYPEEYWEEETRPEFRPFERSTNIRVIPGRDCRVTVCSSENDDSTRGMDVALAHLSEVAFWRDTVQHKPSNLIRSVTSGIMRKPLSCVVLESTANGTGNFFHREWIRAHKDGSSDKVSFFVPWFEIDLYSEPVADVMALWESLDEYERGLWEEFEGVTLEGLSWYKTRRREHEEHRSMMAEFPSRPDEAFTATDVNVFSPQAVERLREGCREPDMRGEVRQDGPGFAECPEGRTLVWVPPRPGASYVAAVDVGGRSVGADWSVITVVDRCGEEGLPEVVARWRGHIDHDLLARKAERMAGWYNNALLVVESNTLESDMAGEGQFILERLSDSYRNLYHRPSGDGSGAWRVGFHTNRSTKAAIIANLVEAVRDRLYTERDSEACNELLQYEQQPGGGYAAAQGCHDDLLMTRAIALWVHASDKAPRSAPTRTDIDSLLSLTWV
ncbi:MAG: hypothetical protein NC039_08350 [Muribaculaceae bacterium]|nr:hypothetical protein [Muribaculaceae bacterium]